MTVDREERDEEVYDGVIYQGPRRLEAVPQ